MITKIVETIEETTIVATETEKPPRVKPRLSAAPAIRQLYWCDFPEDAQLPEFWKRRPVVIVSYKNTLTGAVTIIPCSSQDQSGNKWAVKLETTIDYGESWAICDKPTTVAVSRLSVDRVGIKRLAEAEFNEILALILKWFPRLPA
jgi:mRNA interferase MazF